jgi:glycolate oxidase iron-sulfur subunit
VLAAGNRAAMARVGTVLCLASGCQGTLARALDGVATVEDPLVLLDRHADALRFDDAGGLVVALHLPCTQSALPGSVPATRRLLARVPGLRVVALPEAGCCGAAGLHMLEFPDRAAALRAPLLDAFARSGATQLVSANIGCRLHLANALDAPVRHPLDLLGDFLAGPMARCIHWTDRMNTRRLSPLDPPARRGTTRAHHCRRHGPCGTAQPWRAAGRHRDG